jgi:AcrR family transcriptional regulator
MARAARRRAGTRLVPRAVREEQMLEVAGEVFAERGFHAASMDDIAERADISKPMLYAYFGNKEGLYSSYMQRVGTRLLAAMDAAVDPALEPGPQVYASMFAFLGFVEEHREGWAVLQRELAAGEGGPLAEDVGRVRAAIVKRMAALLSAHVGETRADALAHGFVGAGESLAAWWLDHPDHTREEVADLIMDVGWTGIGHALTGAPEPR